MSKKEPEEIMVYYQSGITIHTFGRLLAHGRDRACYMLPLEVLQSTKVGDTIASPGTVLLLDPRAVVCGLTTGVLYNPRDHWRDFPPPFYAWMKENPDWPNHAELGKPQ
jgi:hypothetical protein